MPTQTINGTIYVCNTLHVNMIIYIFNKYYMPNTHTFPFATIFSNEVQTHTSTRDHPFDISQLILFAHKKNIHRRFTLLAVLVYMYIELRVVLISKGAATRIRHFIVHITGSINMRVTYTNATRSAGRLAYFKSALSQFVHTVRSIMRANPRLYEYMINI